MIPNHILDLAARNDGYLTITGDPAISELLHAGLITVQYLGDGCLLIRAVPKPLVHINRTARGRWSKPSPSLEVRA